MKISKSNFNGFLGTWTAQQQKRKRNNQSVPSFHLVLIYFITWNGEQILYQQKKQKEDEWTSDIHFRCC